MYTRVLEEGDLQVGDAVDILPTPNNFPTVAELYALFYKHCGVLRFGHGYLDEIGVEFYSVTCADRRSCQYHHRSAPLCDRVMAGA